MAGPHTAKRLQRRVAVDGRLSGIMVLGLAFCLLGPVDSWAAAPQPTLDEVFPAGAQAGTMKAEITVGGSLAGLTGIRASHPGIQFTHLDKLRFHVAVDAGTPPGTYDIQALCGGRWSSTRSFYVTRRRHVLETPSETEPSQAIPLDSSIAGRISEPGQVDRFRFAATAGRRVVIEAFAHRLDSPLRAILELRDQAGRLIASNRGYFGVDPLIDFRVARDGTYVVSVYDLTYTGGKQHVYRLDVDTGPRVAFAMPPVIQRGKAAEVTLFGWNLSEHSESSDSESSDSESWDRVPVRIRSEQARPAWPLPVTLKPAQAAVDALAYDLPHSHGPVLIGVSDVAVTSSAGKLRSPDAALPVSVPGEVIGQLRQGDQQDWYAIGARRGEVLYLDALGRRIGSPVDLAVSVLDADMTELARFNDVRANPGRTLLPTAHLDPAGRWRVPRDGRFLVMVHNVTGGLVTDARRTYRLRVRREEPAVQVIAIPRHSPTGVNVSRGGNVLLDLVALRQRGCDGSIRVSAVDLPVGVACDDVWLGPGVDGATLLVEARENATALVGELKLASSGTGVASRPVRGATVVRPGRPTGWSRLQATIPLAVAGDAPLTVTADGHERRDHHLYGNLAVRHSPGGVLDVAVHVRRRRSGHQADVKLIGVGLPPGVNNQTASIPAGEEKGYISFRLPSTMRPGKYSLSVGATTTVLTGKGDKTETVTVYAGPVVFQVHPAAFQLTLDPYAPRRVKRGAVVQVKYSAHRTNGFIGKIHTELAAPGRVTDVGRLRGRGVTFVGQTEQGAIQIIVNPDAPLGRLPFLRLYGVGVVEDQPTYHGSCWLPLEIVD